MNNTLRTLVLEATGASAITSTETLQTLWSGYGEIVRVGLSGANQPSVIVKYISPPDQIDHPRGWNNVNSHQRKLTSYDVEMHWYRHWSQRCAAACRVPHCYHAASLAPHEDVIILEDLDHAGYPHRKNELDLQQTQTCLRWLAHFHATFLGDAPGDLWSEGSYWHLKTRPDEWAAMAEGPLKAASAKIDQRLKQSRFQTIIHGDAKVANFCFSESGKQVAAVDFQYVGGGCGMKDIAYFLGSCLTEDACEMWQETLLDTYFQTLKLALEQTRKPIDTDALEHEWRQLYPWAWADFHRFLQGWNPGHWKLNGYSERQVRHVLKQL